jgi:hypothetical protein
MFIKQPNGLYCRYSNISDMPEMWDMTKEDIKDYILLKKIKEAESEFNDITKNHIKSFDYMRDSFCPNNITQERFDEICKEMAKEAKPCQE